jgi:H+/gluconate symporter-like permease
MKTAEKLATGWLLTLGFMFLTLSASAVMAKNTMLQSLPPGIDQPRDFQDYDAIPQLDNTALYGLIFGVPTSVLGIWMGLDLYRQGRQAKKVIQQQTSDRLQSIFYHLIQENHGRITVLNFAMQSQLPAATAKQYLDEQAKQFNANFTVNEDGGVSYHFDV